MRSDGLLLILFALSGALALVYEVLWQRQFSLVFGSAAPATAAVLSAFFAGLGFGSRLGGSARLQRYAPLRLYAFLELGVALGAMAVPLFLHLFDGLAPVLEQSVGRSPTGQFLAKTILTFVALAVPTACMGATLPALGRLLEDPRRAFTVSPGALYSVNTLGAALGAISVPFFFLPRMGASQTLMVCMAGNVLVALLSLWLSRRQERRVMASVPRAAGALASGAGKGSLDRGDMILACGSGAALFMIQVLWNRAFSQVHENSLYSFAVIAALFILALSLAAELARRLVARNPRRDWVAWSWGVGGLLIVVGPWWFLHLTHQLAYLPADKGWGDYAQRLVTLTCLVIGPAVVVLGLGFPALLAKGSQVSAGATRSGTALALGRLLTANLVGSVVGALLAGFVLPRWLTLWQSLMGVGGLLSLVGLARLLNRKERGLQARAVVIPCVLLLLSLILLGPLNLPRVRLATAPTERLVALSEGPLGIVAVVEREGSRRMKLNNHYVLGGTASVGDERMQAHLPLLMHPQPREVLFLGLGTGITASGSLFHPVTRITAVELVPEVVTAARDYFGSANAGFLEERRVRVVTDDARSYLRTTQEKFDVIVGDLIVPWREGEGALFTLEQFTAARRSLNPGGIFCQWVPLFQLSERELQILIRTFVQVFPNTTLWRGDFAPGQPALGLMGMQGDGRPDAGRVQARLKEVQPDPSNPHLPLSELFWMYALGPVDASLLLNADPRINQEDRPWIELLGPLDASGEGGRRLFVGRKFERWTKERLRVSKASLESWGSGVGSGAMAGDLMHEIGLNFSEGSVSSANEGRSRLKQALSPAAFEALFGKE